MKKPKNDRALRFYTEVLGLERLHYGLWSPDDELNYSNLKAAQERYENYLIDHLPDGSKHLLDVGCGNGTMSARLKAEGFDIEGLSPDVNQKTMFSKNVGAPFHFCRFEDFKPADQFDCLIMSESAQYIPMADLFRVAANALKSGGQLMVCDYFVRNDASGILARSGHNYEQFLAEAETANFKLLQEQDITGDVVKTLDIARFVADRARIGLSLLTEKFQERHPHMTRLVLWLFRKKIRSVEEQLDLIDSDKFRQNKKYVFLLFELKA